MRMEFCCRVHSVVYCFHSVCCCFYCEQVTADAMRTRVVQHVGGSQHHHVPPCFALTYGWDGGGLEWDEKKGWIYLPS